MKWLLEKYEYLFWILYKKFKTTYPKNDDIIRYPIFLLSVPLALIIGSLYNYCFNWLPRIVPIIVGLLIIIPQFYYFDKRISKIENRYDNKKKENSKKL